MPSASDNQRSLRQLHREIDDHFATLFRSTPHETAPLSPQRKAAAAAAASSTTTAPAAPRTVPSLSRSSTPPLRDARAPLVGVPFAPPLKQQQRQQQLQQAPPARDPSMWLPAAASAPTRIPIMTTNAGPVAANRASSVLRTAATNAASSIVPPTDVIESTEYVQYLMDLPGVKCEDITIELHKQQLWVRGTKPKRLPTKNERFTSEERVTGQFSRFIDVPLGVDQHDIYAKCVDGVLCVTLKRPEPRVQLEPIPNRRGG